MRLITRVTSLDTSSVFLKVFPRSCFFNFGNKSKSGGLMSGMYGGWGRTCHPYFSKISDTAPETWGRALSLSLPTEWFLQFWEQVKVWWAHVRNVRRVGKHLPSILFQNFRYCTLDVRPSVIVENEDTGCEHGRHFLANLWKQNILQKLSGVCRCYSGPRRHSVCYCHSILVVSNNHHELNFRLLAATFFRARRSCMLPLRGLRFQLWFKISYPCFIYGKISVQKLLTFCLVAPQQFFCDPLASCFCSSLSWCRTHFAATFLFCSVWVTILKTEAVDMCASRAVSSHDLRRSSSNRVLTITTDVLYVAVTGRSLLGSSWMLTRPSRKRDAYRDTMLRSTTLSPHTSCKAL